MGNKISPFDYVKALTKDKKDIIREEGDETYKSFVINRALSYHSSCVMYANEMNGYQGLDKIPQHDYYLNGIPKKELPFIRWGKKPAEEDLISFVMNEMGYSRIKAENALQLLSKERIDQLTKDMESKNAC